MEEGRFNGYNTLADMYEGMYGLTKEAAQLRVDDFTRSGINDYQAFDKANPQGLNGVSAFSNPEKFYANSNVTPISVEDANYKSTQRPTDGVFNTDDGTFFGSKGNPMGSAFMESAATPVKAPSNAIGGSFDTTNGNDTLALPKLDLGDTAYTDKYSSTSGQIGEEGIWDQTKAIGSDIWDGTKAVGEGIVDGAATIGSGISSGFTAGTDALGLTNSQYTKDATAIMGDTQLGEADRLNKMKSLDLQNKVEDSNSLDGMGLLNTGLSAFNAYNSYQTQSKNRELIDLQMDTLRDENDRVSAFNKSSDASIAAVYGNKNP